MTLKAWKTKLIVFIVLLCSCLILIYCFKSRISTDIKVLLSRDKWIENHLDFLRNSQIGTVIAISIEAKNQNKTAELANSAKKLSMRFSKLANVKSVLAEIQAEKSIYIATCLFKHIPEILDSADLQTIDRQIRPAELTRVLKTHYETILRPGGLFRQKLIASDPLNLFKIPLNRLQYLGKNSGFTFKIINSHLWSADNKHLLMLIYTDIPVTDPEKAEILHKAILKQITDILPETDFSHIIISGHRHAIDNRKLLKHDIFITLTVAGIGFFLLFAIFFRDWRACFVFAIPIVAMICAVSFTLVVFKHPSAIILGLGATVIGIALDYGIHVFAAAKHIRDQRIQALKNIRKPLIFSALTTLGVFWAFFFSDTPGYHQLAFASTFGVGLSLLFSLKFLPALLPEKKTELKTFEFLTLPSYNKKIAAKTLLLWFMISVVAVSSIRFTGFEPDIRKLDGTSQKLKNDEAQFKKIWGENRQAAISVTANNLESAAEQQDRIAKFAKKAKISNFQSLSAVCPSTATRIKNATNWDKYWRSGKEQEFRQNLITAGKAFSFSEAAFNLFFDKLYQHNPSENLLTNPQFQLFTKKFINYENNKVRVISYFPDNPNTVARMRKLTAGMPNTEIISPSSFGTYISGQIINNAKRIAIISIVLVLLLAYSCLRNLAKTAVALLPVISAILIVIPTFAIMGMKINAVALVACIVVTGLAIDYGIFVVSACSNNEPVFSKDALQALTLSMLSTAIGAAALLFAGHQALRSVGLVISAGVLSSYLSAIFVSPALFKLICKTNSQAK